MTTIQIGYLKKGPKEFAADKVLMAKEKAKNVMALAITLQAFIGQKKENGQLRDVAVANGVDITHFSHIPVCEYEEVVNHLNSQLAASNLVLEQYVDKLIDEFIAWWPRTHIIGDSYSRPDPDNPELIMCYSGCQTENAVEPVGYGYTMIKIMTELNCLASLGVR